MPWPVSVSFGVGRGPRPNEQPSSLTDVDCSGDRLSLVSSSNEEFSPEALWSCVSERRSIVGEMREGNKHYLVKLDHKINVLPSDSRSLPKSVCVCNTITCINRSWATGLLLVTLTPCGHLQSRQITVSPVPPPQVSVTRQRLAFVNVQYPTKMHTRHSSPVSRQQLTQRARELSKLLKHFSVVISCPPEPVLDAPVMSQVFVKHFCFSFIYVHFPHSQTFITVFM